MKRFCLNRLTQCSINCSRADEAAQLFVQTKRLKGKSYRDAADEPEAKPKKDAKGAKKTKDSPAAVREQKGESLKAETSTRKPAASPRTGLTVEVVIPVAPKRRASPASSVATAPPTSEAEPDEDSDAPRSRRAVKRKAVVISDDDESESDVPKKGKAPAKKRPAKRSKASDDDDYAGSPSEASDSGEEPEEDASEESNFDSDEDDEDEQPKKGKGKAKAVPKKRAPAKKPRSAPATSESEDAMDVNDTEESKSSAKGKKQPAKKRKTEDKPPKEKKRREDSDPWKLKSSSVQSHWKKMQAPPLEMFHFARKIVDEYTYLDGKVLSMVTSVKAERHWVLSGTPPIHDFGALKTISAFLNIHLGIDDDNEGQSLQVKKRKREQTGVFYLTTSVNFYLHPTQLSRSSTLSGRFIAWSGMRTVINLANGSSTNLFDRSVRSLSFLTCLC